MWRWAALALLLGVSTAACGPEPTPFPVELPATPTPTPAPESLPPLRYALSLEAAAAVPDLAALQNGAQVVVPLLADPDPAALGRDYDVLVGYGSIPDGEGLNWQAGALMPQLSLVLDADARPFADPDLRMLLLAALDVDAAVAAANIPGLERVWLEDAVLPAQTRTALANSGYPDGTGLALAVVSFPGVDVLTAQLREAGFVLRVRVMTPNAVRAALDSGTVQAALLVSGLAEEQRALESRYGTEQVVPLYRVPVRFQVAAGLDLSVSFTPEGLPLFRR